MRKTKEDYPSVHTWSYITIEEFPKNSSCHQVLTNCSKIEGYCMLNMDYGGCYSRYSYELKPDRSLKRVKNKEYDPSKKPDPYPEGCPRSVRSTCMDCKHFAWCDPTDDEKYDPEPDTILMVESFIKEHSGEYKKRALWENLPRKSMYQTYSTIISYLQDSGKIAADAKGKDLLDI